MTVRGGAGMRGRLPAAGRPAAGRRPQPAAAIHRSPPGAAGRRAGSLASRRCASPPAAATTPTSSVRGCGRCSTESDRAGGWVPDDDLAERPPTTRTGRALRRRTGRTTPSDRRCRRPGHGLPAGLGRHRAPGPAVRWDPGRPGARALWVAGLLAALLLVGWTWLDRPTRGAGARRRPVRERGAGRVRRRPTPPVGEVGRHVARRSSSRSSARSPGPGWSRCPSGARVADAVEAAGGLLPEADPASVNLAAVVADGQQIAVGVPGARRAGAATAAAAGRRRRAARPEHRRTVAELDALPGIGPVLAQRIVDHRDARGAVPQRRPAGRRPGHRPGDRRRAGRAGDRVSGRRSAPVPQPEPRWAWVDLRLVPVAAARLGGHPRRRRWLPPRGRWRSRPSAALAAARLRSPASPAAAARCVLAVLAGAGASPPAPAAVAGPAREASPLRSVAEAGGRSRSSSSWTATRTCSPGAGGAAGHRRRDRHRARRRDASRHRLRRRGAALRPGGGVARPAPGPAGPRAGRASRRRGRATTWSPSLSARGPPAAGRRPGAAAGAGGRPAGGARAAAGAGPRPAAGRAAARARRRRHQRAWTPCSRRTSGGPGSPTSPPSPARTSRSCSPACCGRCAGGPSTGGCRRSWPGSALDRLRRPRPAEPERRPRRRHGRGHAAGAGRRAPARRRAGARRRRCACCCSSTRGWPATPASRSPWPPPRRIVLLAPGWSRAAARRAAAGRSLADAARGERRRRPGRPRRSSPASPARSAWSRCRPTCSPHRPSPAATVLGPGRGGRRRRCCRRWPTSLVWLRRLADALAGAGRRARRRAAGRARPAGRPGTRGRRAADRPAAGRRRGCCGGSRALRPLALAALVGLVVVGWPLRQAVRGWPPAGHGRRRLRRRAGRRAACCPTGSGRGRARGRRPRRRRRSTAAWTGSGIDALPLVLLSHLDADHVGGLAGALGRPGGRRRRHRHARRPADERVGALDAPGAPQRRRARGARARGPARPSATVAIEVLAPGPERATAAAEANDLSLVVRVTVRGLRILLTGDLGAEAEARLVGRRDRPARRRAQGAAPRQRRRRPGVPRRQRRPGGADLGRARTTPTATRTAGCCTWLARAGMRVHRTDREGDLAVVGSAASLGCGGTRERRPPAQRPGRTAARAAGPRGAGASAPRDTMQACRPTPWNPPPACGS